MSEIAQAYYGRGRAYEEKWEWDKAIADYNELIRLDPTDAGAYDRRGWAYGTWRTRFGTVAGRDSTASRTAADGHGDHAEHSPYGTLIAPILPSGISGVQAAIRPIASRINPSTEIPIRANTTGKRLRSRDRAASPA